MTDNSNPLDISDGENSKNAKELFSRGLDSDQNNCNNINMQEKDDSSVLMCNPQKKPSPMSATSSSLLPGYVEAYHISIMVYLNILIFYFCCI